MEHLTDKTTNKRIARTVERAGGFRQRVQGLLGRKSLPPDRAFWISPCPSIHTFFMKFSIDVIFADRNLKVVSVFYAVPPYRMIFGGWKSHSVFELKADQLKKFDIKKGNQLYVGH